MKFAADRTWYLLVIVSFTTVLLLMGRPSQAEQVPNGHRSLPNIVVIYTDDQGFGDASCLNPDSKFQTPNLDRLASEGIRFTDAHCSDAVCTPSRYGLLTGRYAWRTRLKRGVMRAEGACLIQQGRVTLGSLLRTRGYSTAMVGKWHLGMDFPGEVGSRDWSLPVRDMPLDKGFDYFFGIPASLNYGVLAWFRNRHAKVPPLLYTNKKPNQRHVDYRIMPPYEQTPEETQRLLGRKGMEVAEDFVDSECLTRFTDEAIAWMKQQASKVSDRKPFFLYLPFTSPHYPVCPLPEFRGRGQAGAYGEFVIETDHHVGRILQFLKQAGIDSNTLVVFTSDNGPENSWRGRIDEFGHHSNYIYREGKRSIYEGGHRVPMFVRWPDGIVDPGRSCDEPTSQTDLLATVAEIVGTPLPEGAGEDSVSFARVLRDQTAGQDRSPIIHHAANGQFAIRHRQWKLVLPHQKKKAELYDLSQDPGETNDVFAERPEIANRLLGRATEIVVRGRSTEGPPQKNDTEYWSDLKWIKPSEYARR